MLPNTPHSRELSAPRVTGAPEVAGTDSHARACLSPLTVSAGRAGTCPALRHSTTTRPPRGLTLRQLLRGHLALENTN